MKRIIKTTLAIIGTKYVLLRAIGKFNRIYFRLALGIDYAILTQWQKKDNERAMRYQVEELVELCEKKGKRRAADYAQLWLTAWDWANEKLKR